MFQFPARKKRQKQPVPEGRSLIEAAQEAEENLPTVIQGRKVDSIEEARVAIALEILGWRYIYQKAYYGGRTTPGGIVVDFLVMTPGPLTPLEVKSRYWHEIVRRADDDFYRISRLRRIPNLAAVKEIWDYEARSVEQTINTLTLLLGSA